MIFKDLLISFKIMFLVVFDTLKVELNGGYAGVMMGITFLDLFLGFHIDVKSVVLTCTDESRNSQRRMGSGQLQFKNTLKNL
jgi:esterase/lipase